MGPMLPLPLLLLFLLLLLCVVVVSSCDFLVCRSGIGFEFVFFLIHLSSPSDSHNREPPRTCACDWSPQSHGSRSSRLKSAANATRKLLGNYQCLCVYLLHAAATATLVDRIAIRAAIREAAKLWHGDTPANPPNHQREEPALE